MRDTTVLIVEDEPALRDMISFAMSSAGFQPLVAADSDEAYRHIDQTLPDLILMDWMLPGVSGVDLARRLRRDEYTRDVPVIMLTARTEERDKLSGFDAGVDDYIVKPFSPRELVARIKAVLRRVQSPTKTEPLQAAGISLDPESHRVVVNGEPIKLGPSEYNLLKFFMSHIDRVYSREQLLDRVWGRGSNVEERTVDVHILRLRKALKRYDVDRCIQTVRGAGYRFSLLD